MALVGLGVGVDYALFVVSRHRQELRAGRQPEASVITAMTTSGRAVLYAGIVVCIAVLGMFTLGVTFFNGLAVATAIGVALSMAAALTLLTGPPSSPQYPGLPPTSPRSMMSRTWPRRN
jgi:RND superfamily putative drug exporter